MYTAQQYIDGKWVDIISFRTFKAMKNFSDSMKTHGPGMSCWSSGTYTNEFGEEIEAMAAMLSINHGPIRIVNILGETNV